MDKNYKLQFDLKDDELIREIKKAKADAETLHDKMMQKGKLNYLFWKDGTDEDLSLINSAKSKVVNNRIFTDVETSVPILTANTPEPTILNVNNTLRENYADVLTMFYEVHLKLQQKIQLMVRNWYSYYVGILKYFWDKENQRPDVKVCHPKKIFIDRTATEKSNCEFIIEELEEDIAILAEKYKKEAELKKLYPDLKGKIKYHEVWFEYGKSIAWVILDKNIVLDKIENPNFSKDGTNLNSFKKPEFAYIFFNVFRNSDETSLYDDTSLIEQCISLQRDISKRERQISDLTEGQKRVWIYDVNKLKEEKAQMLVNETGDIAVGVDGAEGIEMKLGQPDISMYNSLAHLLGEIDNIMGIHSTTRGEREARETLGGRQLLQGADFGRQDLIVRNVEQTIEELYNAFFQLLITYATEPITYTDENREITVDPAMIPLNLMIMVKKGSTLPTDDKSRMEMAIQLAQYQMIDPKTLFEELGYGNEDERVKNLYIWLVASGKLSPEAINLIKSEASPQNTQMQKLSEILGNPEIQKLSVEEQQKIVEQGKEILSKVK